MPGSTFARRTSNAVSSSNMASSSSSASQGAPSNPYQNTLPMMGTTGTIPNPGSTSVAATNASAAPVAIGQTGISEFGSSGFGNRGPEGSSRTTSPSLSPTLGGAQGSFTSGSATANHSISQSMQANNWDLPNVQSATHSTFTTSTIPSNFAGSSSSHSDSLLREAFARRIRCLSYLKRCISIVSYPTMSHSLNVANTPAWLDVIKLSKRDLEAIYESERMKRRTSRNHILGCSIAHTLDYTSSAEFARAILAIFSEVETVGEGGDKDRAKMRNFFKSSVRGTRRGMAGMDLGGVLEGGGGSAAMTSGMGGTDLLGTQVPFPLDFFQTTITLFDLLVEVYHKFTFFLSNGKDVGTWNSTTSRDSDMTAEAHYPTVAASTLDTMNKIDVRVKKMLGQTCKELDALARHVVREELATIDPLMARELGLLDSNGGHFGAEASMHQAAE